MRSLPTFTLMGVLLLTACTSSMPGAAPAVTLSASSVMFGQEVVGTASDVQPVTLNNNGSAALQIVSIETSSNFQVSSTCGGSVAPGTSCAVNVKFTPSVSGRVDGRLTVTDNAAGSPHTVLLSGTGSLSGGRCLTKGMQCPSFGPPCCAGLTCIPASTRAFCE